MFISFQLFPKIWIFDYTRFTKGGVRNHIAKLSPIRDIKIKSIICSHQNGFISLLKGRSTTTNFIEFVTFCLQRRNLLSGIG